MPTTWDTYDRDAAAYAARYDAVDPDALHRVWWHLLPAPGATALDVGAGSGRDAAWLAGRGLNVVAVEPAAGMRDHARATYRDARVTWLDDRLPTLAATRALHRRFDVVLLNAVWIHVPPAERGTAMGALAELLAPRGVLVLTLRHGPLDPERPMWVSDAGELDRLAGEAGLTAVESLEGHDRDFLGRDDISWTVHAFRAPATAG